MGHALNSTLQDVLVRWRRMKGDNALWIPGTDHGGIATQNVVEKILKKEGKTRHDLGREKFLERMWAWRKESGDTILHQLRKLGCSLDWTRTRFTMDEASSRAVAAAFVEFFRKGLIQKGERRNAPGPYGTFAIRLRTTRPREWWWPPRGRKPCWETPPWR